MPTQRSNRDWKRRNRDRLNKQRRDAYAADPEPHLQRERARREAFPVRCQAQRLRNSVGDRCRALGLERPAWVTSQYIEAWLTRQPSCACCSVIFHCGEKQGKWREDSPSIDRFDPACGYELSNVSLICWRCNNIKRNYTAADLRRVAAWIDARGNQTDKFEEEPAAA